MTDILQETIKQEIIQDTIESNIIQDQINLNKVQNIIKNIIPSAKWERVVMTIKEYINDYYKLINCYPVGQRLPVPNEEEKREGIISSILKGINIGEITICKNDLNTTSALTPIYDYESIDGGHRKRYIKAFTDNKFSVDGKYYNQLTAEEKYKFDNYQLSFCVYEPLNNETKGYIFRTLNCTTDINHQEKLNSYGDIFIANLIRQLVRSVHLIDNSTHELFELSGSKDRFRYLDFNNDRLKIEEFVARIVFRYTQPSLLGPSSDKQLEQMYQSNNFDEKKLIKKIKEHFDYLLKCAIAKKEFSDKLIQADFKLLSLLHFYLIDLYGSYRIDDHKTFMKKFREAYNIVSDNTGKYSKIFNDECRSFDSKSKAISVAFTSYLGAPDHEKKLKQSLLWLLKEFDVKKYIIILDPKRSFDITKREEILSKQNWKCFIDNDELHLHDAVISHIVAHADGGMTTDDNVVAVRKEHNLKMGTMNLNDYKKIYEKKKKLIPKTVKEVI